MRFRVLSNLLGAGLFGLALAMSSAHAVMDGSGHITEEFTGWFSISSLAGGGGINYLSNTFFDAVFGSGTGLTMTSSGPAWVPTFSSAVIGDLSHNAAFRIMPTGVRREM
jgi:hypothetical protein